MHPALRRQKSWSLQKKVISLQIRFAKYENKVAEEMEVCVTAITVVLQILLFPDTTLIDTT